MEILTDHRNLKYFKTAQKLNRHQIQWSIFLSRFNLVITYRPGKSGGKPDALSRCVDHKPDNAEENKDVVLLPPGLFKEVALRGNTAELPLLVAIRQESVQDDGLTELRQCFPEDWKQEHRIWSYRGFVYMPKSMRARCMKEHHDSPVAGHPGRDNVVNICI